MSTTNTPYRLVRQREEEKVAEVLEHGNKPLSFIPTTNLRRIVADPCLLEESLHMLAKDLVEEVRGTLSPANFALYQAVLRDLQKEVLVRLPNQMQISQLVKTLLFFGEIPHSLTMQTAVCPYLYSMLMLVDEKLAQLDIET